MHIAYREWVLFLLPKMKVVSEGKNLSIVTQLIRAKLGSILPCVKAGWDLRDHLFQLPHFIVKKTEDQSGKAIWPVSHSMQYQHVLILGNKEYIRLSRTVSAHKELSGQQGRWLVWCGWFEQEEVIGSGMARERWLHMCLENLSQKEKNNYCTYKHIHVESRKVVQMRHMKQRHMKRKS